MVPLGDLLLWSFVAILVGVVGGIVGGLLVAPGALTVSALVSGFPRPRPAEVIAWAAGGVGLYASVFAWGLLELEKEIGGWSSLPAAGWMVVGVAVTVSVLVAGKSVSESRQAKGTFLLAPTAIRSYQRAIAPIASGLAVCGTAVGSSFISLGPAHFTGLQEFAVVAFGIGFGWLFLRRCRIPESRAVSDLRGMLRLARADHVISTAARWAEVRNPESPKVDVDELGGAIALLGAVRGLRSEVATYGRALFANEAPLQDAWPRLAAVERNSSELAAALAADRPWFLLEESAPTGEVSTG